MTATTATQTITSTRRYGYGLSLSSRPCRLSLAKQICQHRDRLPGAKNIGQIKWQHFRCRLRQIFLHQLKSLLKLGPKISGSATRTGKKKKEERNGYSQRSGNEYF